MCVHIICDYTYYLFIKIKAIKMKQQLIECVPNISEGRDLKKINTILIEVLSHQFLFLNYQQNN